MSPIGSSSTILKWTMRVVAAFGAATMLTYAYLSCVPAH